MWTVTVGRSAVCTSRLSKQEQMSPGSSATSAAHLVVSGRSLGPTGSDELPGSSRVDSREVDVGIDAADDGAQ